MLKKISGNGLEIVKKIRDIGAGLFIGSAIILFVDEVFAK